ncbi:MAG: hypothetical protein M9941_12155 [Anaerolineae bacterium]|nr:hypothetical protein [Anaerolineae bacterium]MCO5198488.1 hypothetical protein [Anaerolineae bacterium]
MSRPKVSFDKLPGPQEVGPNTRFYIDYDWWEKSNLSLESYLSSRVDSEISFDNSAELVDTIDPHTGEVRQVSQFEFALQRYFQQLPDNYLQRASLVDAVFSVLLANGNRPMSAIEIADAVKRLPDVIFQTFGRGQVYRGIRPYIEE